MATVLCLLFVVVVVLVVVVVVVVVLVVVVVVVVVCVVVAAAWNSSHQAELRGPHPIVLQCAVSARAVGPRVRVTDCPLGHDEPSNGDPHQRECLRRRRSIHSQKNEKLSSGPVIGADDPAPP